MARADTRQEADLNNTSQRRSRWWIPVLTFVVGIGIGVLAVGLLNTSTPDFAAAQSAPPAPPTPAGSQNAPAAGSARVNAACLRVINGAQDVSTTLAEVGPAIHDVNLQQLDDIVRRLQPIQTRLQNDLQDCKVEADVSGSPSPEPSSSSTAEPSASPIPLPTVSPTR